MKLSVNNKQFWNFNWKSYWCKSVFIHTPRRQYATAIDDQMLLRKTNLSRLHWLSVCLVAQSSSLSAEFLAVSSSMVAAALSNSFKCLSLSLMMSSFSSSKLSRCLCNATLAMRNFSISFSKLPIVSIREARVASKYLYWEQKIVTFNWWIQMTVLWCWKSYHCFIFSFCLIMSYHVLSE